MSIAKAVRDLCVFSRHSVLRDPPFSRMDLISCRNLLIYFGADAQRQVLPIFHYALRPEGYLFLGKSETYWPVLRDVFARWTRRVASSRRVTQAHRLVCRLS